MEYNEALIQDPTLPSVIKNEVYRPIQNKLNYLERGLYFKIPPIKREEVEKYFEDPLIYDNIIKCLFSMTPEQREKVEDFINNME